MKKYFVFVAFLICNFSLFAQVQEPIPVMPDTIKTIDPYDEIVWEVKTPGQIYDVAYHPNGQSVFVLNDGVVQMYSVANGTLIKEYGRELNYSLSKMAISKDGSMVAVITLAEQEQIIVFNTLTGKEIMRFRDTTPVYRPDIYNSVDFSLDNKYIVTTGTYSQFANNGFSAVLLVEVTTGKFQYLNKSYYQKNDPNFPVSKYQNFTRAIFSIDGLNIFTMSTNNIRLEKYDVKDLLQKEVLMDGGYITPSDDDNFLKQTRTGKYLLISSSYNYGVYNLLKKGFDLELSKRIGYINSLTLDNKDSILINEEQNGIKIRKFYNKDILYSYHFSSLRHCGISPNDSLLVTSDGLDTLRLIKFKKDKQTSVKNELYDNIISLSIFPNPITNQLNVKINSLIVGNIKIEILNLNSQVLLTQNRNIIEGENNLNIPINNIPNGAYIIRITLNNNSKQTNFIINK